MRENTQPELLCQSGPDPRNCLVFDPSEVTVEHVAESGLGIAGLNRIDESLDRHFIVYEMLNVENGNYYVGQHETSDPLDKYAGSGHYIRRAVGKEGPSKFVKIILFDYPDFESMNAKEQELVQLSNCFPYDQRSYNLKEGGIQGRMSEESRRAGAERCKKTWAEKPADEKTAYSEKMSKITSGAGNGMYGYEWSDEQRQHMSDVMSGRCAWDSMTEEQQDEAKRKISESKRGEKNPMYGKSSEDFMTPEAIAEKNRKISEGQSGTKRMIPPDPDFSGKCVPVKLCDVDSRLAEGWTFYKGPSKPVSAETRAKISASHKGKPSWNKGKPNKYKGVKKTEAQKAAMREKMRRNGTNKRSPEVRARMAAASKGKNLGRVQLINPDTGERRSVREPLLSELLTSGYVRLKDYTKSKKPSPPGKY